MITYREKLNMSPGGVPLVIHLNQYDEDYSLVFDLYASEGTFTIESGTTAQIRGTKTDGEGYSVDATINVSAKTVTVAGDQQMTAAAGRNVFELTLWKGEKELNTQNFILDVEPAALDKDTIGSHSVIKELVNVIDRTDEIISAAQLADAASERAETLAEQTEENADRAEIAANMAELYYSSDTREQLLACFRNVAWVGDNGQELYQALYDALYPISKLTSIRATFVQGDHVVNPSDSLQSLKPYLTVIGRYSDNSTGTIEGYTLDGNLTVGVSTITVSYGGKSDTFAVTVIPEGASAVGIDAVFNPGTVTIYETDTLETLRQYITVTIEFSDGSSVEVSNYALAGSLNVGTNTITASYEGLTDTFTVTVSASEEHISAVFNSGTTVIHVGDALDSLKQYLTVTYVSNGVSTVLDDEDYTLSGTLVEGSNTITVTYGQLTTTFNVTVESAGVSPIYNWDFTKSLVDTVSGLTAETTATRDSNGLTFAAVNKYLDLGTVYSRDRTYEIDIEYIGSPDPANSAYRRIFAFGENGTNTSSNTTALVVAMSTYRPGWYWYLGASWDSAAIGDAVSTVDSYNYFDGKTMKIYIDSSGYGHVYAKTIGADDSTYVKVGVSHAPLANYSTANAHVYAGGISDRLASARITGYRVYEGEK